MRGHHEGDDGRRPDVPHPQSGPAAAAPSQLEEVGNLHAQSAAWSTAAGYYRSALGELADGAAPARCRIGRKLGDCLRQQGDLDEALIAYRDALSVLAEDDELPRARLQARLARVALERGEYQRAIDLATTAFSRLATSDLHRDVAMCQLSLGTALARLGQPAKAQEFFEDALATYRRVDDPLNQGHALFNLGNLAKNACRWGRAARLYERAERLFRENGATWELCFLHLNRAILERKTGRHHAAMAQAEEGLTLSRRLGDQGRLMKIHLLLGQLLIDSGRHDEAEEQLLQGRVLAERQRSRRELALADEFLGDLQRARGRHGEAASNYRVAEERARRISDDNDVLVELLRRRAELALEAGEPAEALALAREGLDSLERCGEEFERGFLEAALADAYAALGELDLAVEAHDRAIRATAGLRLPLLRRAALLRAARCYRARRGREDQLRAASLLQEGLALEFGPGVQAPPACELQLELAGVQLELGDHDAALLSLFEIERLRCGRDDEDHEVDALRSAIEDAMAEQARSASQRYQVLAELPDAVAGVAEGAGDEAGRLLAVLGARLGATRLLLARARQGGAPEIVAREGIDAGHAGSLARRVLDHAGTQADPAGPHIWSRPSREMPWAAADGDEGVPQGSAVAFGLVLGGTAGVVYLDGPSLRLDAEGLGMARTLVALAQPTLVAAEAAGRPVELPASEAFERVLTGCESMRRVLDLCAKVAPSPYTVLLSGETGTGKGLLARTIHDLSPRAGQPFVTVNCAALPETLLESELFGYVKGAFTGAERDHSGLVMSAEGGTLFLDEVAKTSLPMQAKLLQFLDSKEVRPVGGSRSRVVDLRVVVASKSDLRERVEAGDFLEDLYFRLADFPITVPPLRERGDDALLLARHYVARAARELGRPVPAITRGFADRLRSHPWPGNVRELEKVVRRALVLAAGDDQLHEGLLPDSFAPSGLAPPAPSGNGRLRDLRSQVEELEREAIGQALGHSGGNRAEAARQLGISYPTLLDRIRRYGIEK